MTQIRDQIREIVKEEIQSATILETTDDALSDAQEARIRAIIAEELVAALMSDTGESARKIAPKSAELSKRGRPLSGTPAAVSQRRRREEKKRASEAAKVEAMKLTENIGEAVAQTVVAAIQGSSNPPTVIVASTPQNGSPASSTTSTESAEGLTLNI
jgi:hypothetical protein